jgi:hypothetical protein
LAHLKLVFGAGRTLVLKAVILGGNRLLPAVVIVGVCGLIACAGPKTKVPDSPNAASIQQGPAPSEPPFTQLRRGNSLIAPGSGVYGAPGPMSIEDASPNADWIVQCQAREDTNGDGRLAVEYGTHGGVSGDKMSAYLIRGGGPGEVIVDYWGSSRDGHYAVGRRKKEVELYDLKSGETWILDDLIPDEPDTGYQVRGVHFSPDSKWLMFAPATKGHQIFVYVIDLKSGSVRRLSLGSGLLREASLSASDMWIEAIVVPKDTDGNGKLEIRPIRTTSLASGICDGGWSMRMFERAWLHSDDASGDDDAYRTVSVEVGAKWRASAGVALGRYRLEEKKDGWVVSDWKGTETVIVPQWCEGRPLLAHGPTEQVLAACSGHSEGNSPGWKYYIFSAKDFLNTNVEVPADELQPILAESSKQTVHRITLGRTSSTTALPGMRRVETSESPYDYLGKRHLLNWKTRNIRRRRYTECEEEAAWGVYDEHPAERMTYVLRDDATFAPYVVGDCHMWPRMTSVRSVEPGGVMRVDNQVVIPRERVIGVTPDDCVTTYFTTASGHALVDALPLCDAGKFWEFTLERVLDDPKVTPIENRAGALKFVKLTEPKPRAPISASASCIITAPVERWRERIPVAKAYSQGGDQPGKEQPEAFSWEWVTDGHPASEKERLALRKDQEQYPPRSVGADIRLRAAVDWNWGRSETFENLYDFNDPQPLVRFPSRDAFIDYLHRLRIPIGGLANRAATVFDMMRDAMAVKESQGEGQLALNLAALGSMIQSPLRGFHGTFSRNAKGDRVLVLWRGRLAYQIETSRIFEALRAPQIIEGRLYRRLSDRGILSMITEVAANSLAEKLGSPLRFVSIDYPHFDKWDIKDWFIMASEEALCQLSDDAMIQTLTSPSAGESDNWNVVIPD